MQILWVFPIIMLVMIIIVIFIGGGKKLPDEKDYFKRS